MFHPGPSSCFAILRSPRVRQWELKNDCFWANACKYESIADAYELCASRIDRRRYYCHARASGNRKRERRKRVCVWRLFCQRVNECRRAYDFRTDTCLRRYALERRVCRSDRDEIRNKNTRHRRIRFTIELFVRRSGSSCSDIQLGVIVVTMTHWR